jgi:hypothetical protein
MRSETRQEDALTRDHVTSQYDSTQLFPANLTIKDYQDSVELHNWVHKLNSSVLLHAMIQGWGNPIQVWRAVKP